MVTGSFPGVKRPGRGVDHPPASSAEVEERVELYIFYLIILLNLIVPTLLSPVGSPLPGNKRVWFTESHIMYVISLLLVALLTQYILDN
jgi:hypothetical protein